ncbi:hypothetical protein ZIOFF_058306 [Zingiber officinale]|uniref:Uncharacterized protein n=1 Tax=Zingiber officinale TaxID=94328 RepID=A0A8J5F864_ZINOF|nr:hypothetical protein ZIOFF_058306 [Zingiber officinale]
MSYINTQATTSYREALQATEGIEAPALGFLRPAEYQGAIKGSVAAIKQANTQIQLLVTILEKLENLDERIKKPEVKAATPASLPDELRDYRQHQRRRYNAQRALQRIARRIRGQGAYNYTLEQQLDLQTQLQLSMQQRASLVPAEVLYHSRQDDAHHRVYIHRSEEAVLVTNNQVDRAFIQEESFQQLQRSRMRFLHMGIIQVRIQILHRQEEGTILLVVFRDNLWQGDQSIFAIMEIDLTRGTQLVYVIPDTMLTIPDFYRNIQVSFLARGYENWQNGEANILVTRGLVGRLSNTPNVGFAYEVQNVVDYLASHGVRALPGRSYNTRDILGQNWMIRQSTVNIPMQPTEVNTRNLLDGRISISFNNYQAAATTNPPVYNARDEEIPSDEEEITNHIITVFTETEKEKEELLVKRISAATTLPIRRSPGAAGYDIAIDKACVIVSRERKLLTTGICIQVLKTFFLGDAAIISFDSSPPLPPTTLHRRTSSSYHAPLPLCRLHRP